MSSNDLENPVPMSARGLIDAYKQEEGILEIPLKGGEVVKVRRVVDMQEMARIEKAARHFCNVTQKNLKKTTAYSKYLPVSLEVARMITYVKELGVDPVWTTLEILELAKYAGPVLALLHGRIIEAASIAIPETETEAWEDMGES